MRHFSSEAAKPTALYKHRKKVTGRGRKRRSVEETAEDEGRRGGARSVKERAEEEAEAEDRRGRKKAAGRGV